LYRQRSRDLRGGREAGGRAEGGMFGGHRSPSCLASPRGMVFADQNRTGPVHFVSISGVCQWPQLTHSDYPWQFRIEVSASADEGSTPSPGTPNPLMCFRDQAARTARSVRKLAALSPARCDRTSQDDRTGCIGTRRSTSSARSSPRVARRTTWRRSTIRRSRLECAPPRSRGHGTEHSRLHCFRPSSSQMLQDVGQPPRCG